MQVSLSSSHLMFESCVRNSALLSSQIQKEKIRLGDQLNSDAIEECYQASVGQLEECWRILRDIKFLRLHNFGGRQKETQLVSLLASVRAIKGKAQKLRMHSEQQLSLIERRQALYNQNTLPQSCSFQSTIKQLSTQYPALAKGCEHFSATAGNLMGIFPKKCSLEDIQKLQQFAEQLQLFEGTEYIHQAVVNLQTAMQAAAARKKELMSALALWQTNEGIDRIAFEDWSPTQKIYFLSRAEQIINNPFETKFEVFSFLEHIKNEQNSLESVCNLVKNCLEAHPRNPQKKNYWNYAPALEHKCHDIACTSELKDYLFACKIDGLREILSKRPVQNTPPHLIVGAGPAGLMSALSKKIQGLNYQIIEKRPSTKTPRENTITLGKGDPKDLEILFFLGVMTKLTNENRVSLAHNKSKLMEVKICDIEGGLLKILEVLHGADPICYQTEITAIRNNQGVAEVSIYHQGDENEILLTPASVTIADGFSGKTKSMLGISRINLAKPTMIAFSLFKNEAAKSATKREKIAYRTLNALKGIAFLIKVGLHKGVKRTPLEESFAKVSMGGPSAIFRIPDQDYLIRVLRKKEQDHLAAYRHKMRAASQKLEALRLKPETEKRLAKISAHQIAYEEAEGHLASRLKKHAEKVHGVLDFVQALYNPHGHKMKKKAMTSAQDFLVDIQVAQAEKSSIVIGHTPFLIRGDASHSTDPYSGYGCKTTIEEIQADQNFFNIYAPGVSNPVDISLLEWGHEYYQQRMINIGLAERHFYRKQTEHLSRFTTQAIAHETLTQADANQLIRIVKTNQKRKSNALLLIDDSDHLFLENLQAKVHGDLQSLFKAYPSQAARIKYLSRKAAVNWTSQERKMYRKAISQALKDPSSISQKNKAAFHNLCARLAFRDIPEGWMLAVLFATRLP